MALDSPKFLTPALRGSWFLVAGILMGLSIVFFERDPSGRVGLWVGMSIFFAILLIYRVSLKYHLDDSGITQTHLWGFFQGTRLDYQNLTDVEIRTTFASRIVGVSHLILATNGSQPYLTILSQKDPERLRELFMRFRKLKAPEHLG